MADNLNSQKTSLKVAIMQPYFFPYIGQFQLIEAVDRFILFDDVQYIRHGWINRNRLLKPIEGNYYIIVPLAKHSSGTLIKDIKTVEGNEWKEKILRQLEHYKKKSPYYTNVRKLISDCLQTNDTNITQLNSICLKAVCDYIGINYKIEISSQMNLDYSNVKNTDDWAIRISEQLGASEYWNPGGGVTLYDKAKFQNSNIKLSFLQPNLTPYNQHRTSFEPGLSIIDVMMFQSPAEIKAMLQDYQLL
ncbi:MAG TPA: WbqC family protein [Chitinophagaceae bacterium]|nr:WbqC family protein [Chitinophagaceae bacterium]